MTPGAEALARIEGREAEPTGDVRAEYSDVKKRIHELVGQLIPERSRVLVVSKGDEELVRLHGRDGWHFPRTQTGQYGGYHPANGDSAVAHLEELRARGADYFLLPSTYFWWLEHYPELEHHLRESYRLVTRRVGSCLIYHLQEPPSREGSVAGVEPDQRELATDLPELANLLPPMRSLVNNLLPDDAVVLVASQGDDRALQRVGHEAWHFPHDPSGSHVPLEPGDGHSAVAQLESLRTHGVRYLLFPWSSFQDVRDRGALQHYLQRRCRVIALRERICVLFELGEPAHATDAAESECREPLAREQTREVPRGGLLRRLLGRHEDDARVSGDA